MALYRARAIGDGQGCRGSCVVGRSYVVFWVFFLFKRQVASSFGEAGYENALGWVYCTMHAVRATCSSRYVRYVLL